MDNVYFKGCWQNVHYFEGQKPELVNFFLFPLNTADNNIGKMIESKILSFNSVSIHIRRGDYIISPVHKILEMNYYYEAIGIIESKVSDPNFFIFSGDCTWAKKNIKEDSTTFINSNTGENSYRDMQLMSLWKHNIIANSTFS